MHIQYVTPAIAGKSGDSLLGGALVANYHDHNCGRLAAERVLHWCLRMQRH